MNKIIAGDAQGDKLSDDLAHKMEAAMQAEWQRVKGEKLPLGIGEEDRLILFVAISKAVLGYLKDHEVDLETDTRKDAPSGHQHQVVLKK